MFSASLNGSGSVGSLTIGAAPTVFAGPVGNMTPLSALNIAGTTAINGGAIATTGSQTYGGAVTVGGTGALAASSVTFNSTLSAGPNFTVTTSAGQTYGGPVTLTGAVALTDTGGGNIQFQSTITGSLRSLTINTTGNGRQPRLCRLQRFCWTTLQTSGR